MSTAATSPTPAEHGQPPPRSASPTRRPSRATAALLALVALIVLALLLLAGRFYAEYRSFNFMGDAARLHYNGRTYLAGDGDRLTLAQLESGWGGTATTVDHIRPLPGTSVGARDVVAPAGHDCTTLIAVTEDDGRFRQYVLSGGC